MVSKVTVNQLVEITQTIPDLLAANASALQSFRFYTRHTLSIWDKLGQTTVVRVVKRFVARLVSRWEQDELSF